MNAERLRELEEIAARLLALARELPPGEDRHNAFQQIGRFQIRIKPLKDIARGLKAKGSRSFQRWSFIMSLEKLSDESVRRYYESIRQQADADRAHKHHLTSSPSVRARAEQLREEMIRRKLQHSPIRWPS
jgi:hypothetical protein